LTAAKRHSGTAAQRAEWIQVLGSSLLGLFCAAVPLRLFAQSPDAAAILTRAASVYTTAGSLEANFRQVIADENIGTFRSRGRLAQQGTDRFAMRFTDPNGEALVMDGAKLWVYTPSTTPGQVIRMPQPTGTGAPNLVAWLLDRPTERYEARWLRRDSTGADVLHLVPRDATLPFREATISFARADGLPRRIEVTERTGTKRTLTLTSVRSGRRIPTSTFQFNVPRGVRVIDQ
jgi:outer membrane lipoprotein carrier protein